MMTRPVGEGSTTQNVANTTPELPGEKDLTSATWQGSEVRKEPARQHLVHAEEGAPEPDKKNLMDRSVEVYKGLTGYLSGQLKYGWGALTEKAAGLTTKLFSKMTGVKVEGLTPAMEKALQSSMLSFLWSGAGADIDLKEARFTLPLEQGLDVAVTDLKITKSVSDTDKKHSSADVSFSILMTLNGVETQVKCQLPNVILEEGQSAYDLLRYCLKGFTPTIIDAVQSRTLLKGVDPALDKKPSGMADAIKGMLNYAQSIQAPDQALTLTVSGLRLGEAFEQIIRQNDADFSGKLEEVKFDTLTANLGSNIDLSEQEFPVMAKNGYQVEVGNVRLEGVGDFRVGGAPDGHESKKDMHLAAKKLTFEVAAVYEPESDAVSESDSADILVNIPDTVKVTIDNVNVKAETDVIDLVSASAKQVAANLFGSLTGETKKNDDPDISKVAAGHQSAVGVRADKLVVDVMQPGSLLTAYGLGKKSQVAIEKPDFSHSLLGQAVKSDKVELALPEGLDYQGLSIRKDNPSPTIKKLDVSMRAASSEGESVPDIKVALKDIDIGSVYYDEYGIGFEGCIIRLDDELNGKIKFKVVVDNKKVPGYAPGFLQGVSRKVFKKDKNMVIEAEALIKGGVVSLDDTRFSKDINRNKIGFIQGKVRKLIIDRLNKMSFRPPKQKGEYDRRSRSLVDVKVPFIDTRALKRSYSSPLDVTGLQASEKGEGRGNLDLKELFKSMGIDWQGYKR